jgi:dipeptidyl aminopeptidase/acylaminoacyl peptidase
LRNRARQIAFALASAVLIGLAATAWSIADGMAARYLTDTRRAAGRDLRSEDLRADGPTPGTIFFGRARPSEEPPGLRLVRVSDEVRHAGLVPGDVIVSVDGKVYANTREIARGLTRERVAGERITVRVWKQESRREQALELTLQPFLRHPGDLGLAYEDVTIPSESGFTLRGWFIPPPADSDGRSGVFVHGARSSRFQGLRMAEHWHARGYGMLAMDLSGRGSSDGDYVTYTVNERHDVAAMTRWLRARGVPADKLAVFGTSNGGASAIYAAAMDPEIAALALDAPYSDLWAISRETLTDRGFPTILAWPLRWAVERRAGFDVRDVRPIDVIRDISVPVLFIHGDADTEVLPYHSESMHDARLAAGLASERWVLPGGEHGFDNYPPQDEFWARVLDFFDAAVDSTSAQH